MGRFAERHGFDDYEALQRWSVDRPRGLLARRSPTSTRSTSAPSAVLGAREMPGAEWFPGATLNYAEHMLPDARRASRSSRARHARRVELTFNELRERVARRARGLQRARRARRAIASSPTCRTVPETLVAFLATREPRRDLGQRLARVRPAQRDRPLRADRAEGAARGRRLRAPRQADRPRARRSRRSAPACRRSSTSLAPELPSGGRRARVRAACRSTTRSTCCSRRGTTGPAEGDRPRPRRHPARAPQEPRAGLGPQARRAAAAADDDRLDDVERARLARCCCGASIVLFDGDPAWPELGRLWDVAEETEATIVGVSPAYLMACRKAGVRDPEAAGIARARHRRLAAARRGLRLRLRAARPRRPADQRQRRHRRLQRDRLRRPDAARSTAARSRAAASASTPPRSTSTATRSWASSASS